MLGGFSFVTDNFLSVWSECGVESAYTNWINDSFKQSSAYKWLKRKYSSMKKFLQIAIQPPIYNLWKLNVS